MALFFGGIAAVQAVLAAGCDRGRHDRGAGLVTVRLGGPDWREGFR